MPQTSLKKSWPLPLEPLGLQAITLKPAEAYVWNSSKKVKAYWVAGPPCMFKIVGLSLPTKIPQVSTSDLPVSILLYWQSHVLTFLVKELLAFDTFVSWPLLNSYISSGLENEFAIT